MRFARIAIKDQNVPLFEKKGLSRFYKGALRGHLSKSTKHVLKKASVG